MLVKYYGLNSFHERYLDTSKPLIACFGGEFGHELFCFQGRMRYLSKFFPETYILARKGHELLYNDFANFIPCDIPENTAGAICKGFTPDYGKFKDEPNLIPFCTRVATYTSETSTHKRWLECEQDFLKYGSPSLEYDVIIHARHTNKWNTGYKDMSLEKWQALLEKLKGYKVGFVGNSKSSYVFNEITRFTDIPLSELANVLSQTKLFVSTCSGVSHFAALCGCNKLIWGEPKNEIRHKKHWNPFNVHVEYLPVGYDPDVELIYNEICKLI
jgi:hypothetical protein